MGVHRSFPSAVRSDLENTLESIVVKSGDSAPVRSNDSLVSVNADHVFDEMLSPLSSLMGRIPHSTILDPNNLDPNSPKHEAAIKLQKVYKSFRTRRKLADCAVLIEQSWWKLLDFAELKHSSISFFEIDKHETAISRWSRARTRAAKVGKGLSKNGKAQKLALQHWLEAIDPRHRYGHNLHFYYVKWLNSQSKEPFFYWLDIGEGKDVNLTEKCHRSKLQQQCIKYLGPMERQAYEVEVKGGKLFYNQTGELLDTTKEPKGSKWIFVLSTSKTLYVGKKKKGTFQHSSFLAGGATLAAGRIVAENGVLKAVWPHSGHYRPTPENFQDLVSFLSENNVDLTDVKLDCTDEEEESLYLRRNASGHESGGSDCSEREENGIESNSAPREENAVLARLSNGFRQKLTAIEIPCKDNLLQKLKSENQSRIDDCPPDSPMDVDETVEEYFASEVNCSKDDEMKEEKIPEESISRRINSHTESKSFQLGEQLSCKWSSGAGPRIGCLRDYPSQLQNHALEQAKLSPRSINRLRFDSPKAESTRLGSNLSCRSSRHCAMQPSSVERLVL